MLCTGLSQELDLIFTIWTSGNKWPPPKAPNPSKSSGQMKNHGNLQYQEMFGCSFVWNLFKLLLILALSCSFHTGFLRALEQVLPRNILFRLPWARDTLHAPGCTWECTASGMFSKSNPKRTGGTQGKHISSGLACSSSSLRTLCSPRVSPCLPVSPRVSPCLPSLHCLLGVCREHAKREHR